MAKASTEATGLDLVREHAEDLKALAESDLRSAKWAQVLLDEAGVDYDDGE